MIAGKLDIRITIQQLTVANGSDGNPSETWTTYMSSEPAMFKPITGSEGEESNQPAATSRGNFTIRYSNTSGAITPNMRLVYDSINWNITAIDKYTRKDSIVISAEAKI